MATCQANQSTFLEPSCFKLVKRFVLVCVLVWKWRHNHSKAKMELDVRMGEGDVAHYPYTAPPGSHGPKCNPFARDGKKGVSFARPLFVLVL
jgi:hypothetical protein